MGSLLPSDYIDQWRLGLDLLAFGTAGIVAGVLWINAMGGSGGGAGIWRRFGA